MEWTQAEKQEINDRRKAGESYDSIAESFISSGKDCNASALRSVVYRQAKRDSVTFPDIPTGDLPIEDILAQKQAKYDALADREAALKLIEIKINETKPIGIVHFGDPHLDDDGTDIRALRRDIDLVNQTEGMYAASAGDMSNNWVGRMARLYANQSTTDRDAKRLVEWFVNAIDWLYIIGGNHDVWSGSQDPLLWMAAQAGVHYEWHGTRIAIKFPNGKECRINARHDFKGTSQWNILHAAIKAAKLGPRDNIFVCGHRHTSGYMVHPVQGAPVHCLMVAGYKRIDDYAKQNDFQGAEYMESAVTIIDPNADKYNMVTVFTDVQKGCEYLEYLRSR